MNEILKISSQKFSLPRENEWKFSPRPGGAFMAEKSGQRVRIYWVERAGKVSFSVGGQLYLGEIKTPERAGVKGAGSGDSDLRAQFPGKVRKILVLEGALVEEGTPLVLVEAMKMEFSIRAPFSGRVKKIRVQEGQQLSPGELLVDLENGG